MIRPQTMQALQMQGLNELAKVTVPVPVPRADEVLIQTRATTICTSDLFDIRDNPFDIPLPRILGHEAAGVIVSCGSDVQGLKSGILVASHPVVPCLKCAECLRGYRHLCTHMGHLGHDRNGTFAEYFVQRADRVFALPENVPASLGALLEPVAVCLEAIARAGEIKGRSVLIVGDGPFGNMIARLAVKAGAKTVSVIGGEPSRLLHIEGAEIAASVPARSMDVAILAVSAEQAVTTCLAALRPRGRLVIFSLLKDPVPVDLFSLHIAELEIAGACNDENREATALQCLGDPGLALHEIITHQIAFENWKEAFALARDGNDKALKVAITFDSTHSINPNF